MSRKYDVIIVGSGPAGMFAALELAWQSGGDTNMIMTNTRGKRKLAGFAGASAFSGVQVNQGRSAQGVVVGAVDLYISDFGEHKVVLNRYMRDGVLFCLDTAYASTAWLRPIKFEERSKTGDATKGEILCEWTLVGNSPNAHAQVRDILA